MSETKHKKHNLSTAESASLFLSLIGKTPSDLPEGYEVRKHWDKPPTKKDKTKFIVLMTGLVQ